MPSDFDQFMKGREAERENQRTLAEDRDAQWDLLKSLTRSVSVGKVVDGQSLEWGALYGDDYLQLKNVAAVFRLRQKSPQLRDYQVIFDRHSRSPTGVFHDDRSRIASKIWACAPKMEGGSLVWYVSELERHFSAEELSNRIAEELVKYHEEYEDAYKSWPN